MAFSFFRSVMRMIFLLCCLVTPFLGAENKTILITGGAGFIGSNFTEYMYEKHPDYHLIVLDALTYSSTIDNIPTHIRESSRFTFVHGSVCDEKLVDELLQKSDFVVHFAAETDVTRSITDDKVFYETNVMGTRALLHSMVKHKDKVQRFIHISSSEIYGTCEGEEIDETHPMNPRSPYAASKAAADRTVYAYGCTYDLPVVILRFFNNYGPRQHLEKVVAKFITFTLADKPRIIHGSGTQSRDWIYVKDTARAIDAALHVDFEKIRNQVINCGTGKDTSILDIAKAIDRLFQQSTDTFTFSADRPGQVQKHLSSTKKAKDLLHWEAKTSLDEGLKKTISWYKGNPEIWEKHLLDQQIYKDNSVLILEKMQKGA
jgi:dTDP-glucose 4,6-dehydratase